MAHLSSRDLPSEGVSHEPRQIPRGLVVAGLALSAWILFFLAGALVWMLLT